MNKTIRSFFYRNSSYKIFALLFFLFMGIGWFQQTFPVGLEHLSQLAPGAEALDTSQYRAADVYPRLNALSQEARSFYRQVLLTTDLFFPVLFRIMLIVLATAALKKGFPPDHPFYLLALLPFSSMVADLLENSSIALMISFLPRELITFPAITSFLTRYKWISNYVEWGIVGFLVLAGNFMAFKKLIEKRRGGK